MKVLIIIVSYNFERWIDRCLGSLRKSETHADVVVIDNASQDQTVQRIRQDYPEVRLVETGANLGFGRANNIGMQMAIQEGYEAVFLLNQDAWIEPDTLHKLVVLAQKHPEFGLFSPVHRTGKGDKLDPGFSHYSQVKEKKQLPSNDIVSVPFVNAAFWMIPVSVLKVIGGFCPLFYHYGEDKDYVNRLEYHHYQVGYAPAAFGYHDREYRPITHEGFLRNEYVYHLSEYANVNYSWPKAFGYGVLALVKKSFTALAKGDIRLSKEYLRMTFRLLSQSCAIHSCRKRNRLSNPHYIQDL